MTILPITKCTSLVRSLNDSLHISSKQVTANAKFLYGGDNDYDVISSQKKIQNGASEAIYCKAYLIAYPKHVLAGIPPEGRILRSSGDGKNSGEYTAFRKLHLELRSDVGEIMGRLCAFKSYVV